MSRALQTLVLCFFVQPALLLSASVTAPSDLDSFLKKNDPSTLGKDLIVKSITFKGNKFIGSDLLRSKIPFQAGQAFDPKKSAVAINNLYSLGAFKQIEIKAREDGTLVHLIFNLEEKKLLSGTEFKGNTEISSKKITEALNLTKLSYIDEESARNITQTIQTMYINEGYHRAQVSFDLKESAGNTAKVTALFTVDEGEKASIIRVEFKGNKKIPSRKLRKHLLTKERWLLGFSDGSGTYDERRVEQDKFIIENYYFDQGIFNTKVYKTDVDFSQDKKDITVTFYIEENEQYIVRHIIPPHDDIVSIAEADAVISIKEGAPFTRSDVVSSLERLTMLWKEKGYIFAEISDNLHRDDDKKEVDLAFIVNAGEKFHANRITISGNINTRDSLIRRRLDILEGDLITTSKLESSKRAVEFLSFYEPRSVNWSVHRVSDDLADLELSVKEAKTGNFNAQLTYGASGENDQKQELQGSILLEKGNLLGHGIDAGVAVKTGFDSIKPSLRRFEVRLIDPHVFDKDVSCGFYLYHRWDEYDRFKSLNVKPSMHTVGTNVRFGFGLPEIDKRLSLVLDLGVETIHNNNPKVGIGADANQQQRLNLALYQLVIDRTLQQGSQLWVGLDLVKDMRNHQVYPNKGYKISAGSKIAPNLVNQTFSYFKLEAAASMYNAILNEDDLVLGNHLKISNIWELNSSKSIPYKELFHMGGPNTIRGHVWSGIGPAWKDTNEPLGGRSAIQCNNEISFPMARQLGMRGHFFYDLGTAWDAPNKVINYFNAIQSTSSQKKIDDVVIRNNFNLRHTVGFGLNLTSPIPAKIDWGFKLDRQEHESAHEFHLTMNYAW